MQGTIDNNITIIGSFCLELSYFFLFGGLALVPWSWDWALGSAFLFPSNTRGDTKQSRKNIEMI